MNFNLVFGPLRLDKAMSNFYTYKAVIRGYKAVITLNRYVSSEHIVIGKVATQFGTRSRYDWREAMSI